MADYKYRLENSQQRSNPGVYAKLLAMNPSIFRRINGEFTRYAEKL